MKRILAATVIFTSGLVVGLYLRGNSPTALAGGGAPTCSSQSGDVNANGEVDLSDAVTVLNFLFLGNPTQLVPLCETQTSSRLPDTAQANCYNETGVEISCGNSNCHGQDGFYATGCPREGRFIDHGDGTVFDTCTGLMWQREVSPIGETWCEALAFCENLSFADRDDWRLPNVRELQSIVAYGRLDSAIDPVFGVQSPTCWSSTPYAGGTDTAWYVRFFDGDLSFNVRDDGFPLVRAVRDGP